MRLVEERMKGGAVRLERSPLNDAIDCFGQETSSVCEGWGESGRGEVGTLRNELQLLPLACCGALAPGSMVRLGLGLGGRSNTAGGTES